MRSIKINFLEPIFQVPKFPNSKSIRITISMQDQIHDIGTQCAQAMDLTFSAYLAYLIMHNLDFLKASDIDMPRKRAKK